MRLRALSAVAVLLRLLAVAFGDSDVFGVCCQLLTFSRSIWAYFLLHKLKYKGLNPLVRRHTVVRKTEGSVHVRNSLMILLLESEYL